jgi:hypothetical protein
MIQYFLVFLLLIPIAFCIGNLFINKLYKEESHVCKNDFSTVGIGISIGLLIIITLTAITSTFLKTTYLYCFVVLLLPFLFGKYKSNPNIISKIHSKNIIILLILSTSVFFFNYFIFYKIYNLPFYDYIFMSKISSGLIKYHTETLHAGYGAYHSTSSQFLYHYSDMWLNGLISILSKKSETETLLLVTYPLLTFAVLLMSIAIFSKFTANKTLYILGGIGLLFGTKLFLPISGEFYKLIYMYRGIPFSTNYKTLPIFLLAFTGMFLYINDLKKYAFVLFSFIPIFYPTTIPSLASISIGLLLMQYLFFKKNYPEKINYPVHILISIIFIFTFKNICKFEETTKFSLTTFPIKTHVIVLIETIFKTYFEYFVITFITIYFIIKTKLKIIFNPIFSLTALGLLGAFLFTQTQSKDVTDISQAINNISSVLITLTFIELLKFIPQKKIIFIAYLTFGCGIYNMAYPIFIKDKLLLEQKNKISKQFIKSTIFELEKKSPYSNVCTVSKKQPTRWFYDRENPFQFVHMSSVITTPLEIGVLFTPSFDPSIYEASGYPPAFYFKNKIVNIKNILNYLKKNKVTYLLIEDQNAIDPNFLCNWSCISVDRKTQYSFWKVNAEKLNEL